MPKSWDEWAAFVAVAGFVLMILGWILNTYVRQPMDRLGGKFDKLERQTDVRLENHELRLVTIEEWKRYQEGAQHE